MRFVAISEEKRDPLVAVLTERCAQAIRRERELEDENARLEARCLELRDQVDMLLEREAARWEDPTCP